MIYRPPTLNDASALREYVREHHAIGEQSISASLGLPVMEYDRWVDMIMTNAVEGDPEWGKSILYICIDHDRIIGLLSIRYELPAALSEKYGDIGYGVRPSERRKGYATQMLRFALGICARMGKQEVILGCYKDNIASDKVIRKCGGTLLRECDNYKPGKQSLYYTIRTAQK